MLLRLFITVISFISVNAKVCSSGTLMQKRWADQSQLDWLPEEKKPAWDGERLAKRGSEGEQKKERNEKADRDEWTK